MLRHVLRNDIKDYENLRVDWVPGHRPTIFFYDTDGAEIKQLEIGDRSLEELFTLMSDNGFTPSRPVITYPAEPTATASYGGHEYELFAVPNYFKEAEAFAMDRTKTRPGYIATITSAGEDAFISKLLQDNAADKAWLAAHDWEQGHWKWNAGPESRLQFWYGTSDGQGAEGMYVNWKSGEPNNAGGSEDCCCVLASGGWNDADCSGERASLIIEYGIDPLVEAGSDEKTITDKTMTGEGDGDAHIDL